MGGRRFGPARSAGISRLPLSQCKQPMGIAHQKPLTTALNPTGLLPRAKAATDGVQRCAAHLGDILSADWKVDENSLLDPTTRLVNEAQDGVRNSSLRI